MTEQMHQTTFDGQLRQFTAWYAGDVADAPTSAEVAVRIRTRNKPQNLTAPRFALIAVAIVVAMVVIIRFVPSATVGPQATPKSTTTLAPSPTPIPLPSGNQPLDAGRYSISDPTTVRAPVEFTLPAGWLNKEGGFVVKGREGASLWGSQLMFTTWIVDHVFRDACHRESGTRVVSTTAELVDALARQAGRPVGTTQAVSLGDTPVTLIELSVPADFDASSCESSMIRNWTDPDGDVNGGWRSVPGETDDVYVVDTASGPFVILASTMPSADQTDTAELASVVSSVRIGRFDPPIPTPTPSVSNPAPV